MNGMSRRPESKLDTKKRYLQVALNSTLEEAERVIAALPRNDRIIIEAGTPLIKAYGIEGVRRVKDRWQWHLAGTIPATARHIEKVSLGDVLRLMFSGALRPEVQSQNAPPVTNAVPYVIADLKMMDRGATEADIAAQGGADAAVALGSAPIESLNAFIASCGRLGIDAMVDMMNVEYPLAVLRKLKKLPKVVILHRGVDEERDNKEKQIPYHEIKRIKGAYDIMIAVAGGDTPREVLRTFFNDADIAIVWKPFYQSTGDTAQLAKEFLKNVR